MKFMIFVIDNQSGSVSGNELPAIDAFNQRLQDANQLIMAAGIAAPERATLIDNRGESDQVLAESLFSDAEFYSGFWIIQTDSESQALLLAKQASKACNRKVELRPFL